MTKHLLASVLLCIAMSARADSGDRRITSYDRWAQLPSERLLKMGEHYRNVALKPDSALVCYSILANRYYEGHRSQTDIERSVMALTQIAQLYTNDFYDYSKAVSYNMRAQELAEKHNYKEYLPHILLNNAVVNGLINSYSNNYEFSEDVLNDFKKAFDLSLKQENWDVLITSFINMMLRTTFNNKESFIEREMDIVKHADIPKATPYLAYARCLIDGVRAMDSHKQDSALVYFQAALDIAQQNPVPRRRAQACIIANDYLLVLQWGNAAYNEALVTLKTNEKLATDYDMPFHLLDSYKNLSSCYKVIGNQTAATKYYIMYLEEKDNLINKKKLRNAQEARLLYQLHQKNEEMRELGYRQEMKNKLLTAALIFSVVLLVMLVLLYINYRQVRERNKQLYRKSLEAIRTDEEKRLLIEKLEGDILKYSQKKKDESERESRLVDDTKMSDLLHRVFMVMETSDEIFSDQFSLPRLAELVGAKRNNVSEAINNQYNTNFYGLLNEYRIKEACRRINDTAHFGALTIEAIGQSVGFKSRSTFTTVFKQVVGLTPSAYQKMAKSR
ncbi:MAG: helix-turn-helix domain-containing protein [Prevotella sp.]|nr:helix-turn-helix domain-containing protein [Prevotella sp.]